MEEMARDQGISLSEYSNVRDLTLVIFPFMEQNGISVPAMWEQIGKSNFREMVPVLKALITGEEGPSDQVRNAVNSLLNDVAVTASASGQELTEEETRMQAVRNLLEDGVHMTNRELRTRLRPSRTPAVSPVIISDGERRLVLIELETEDQYTMFQRKMAGYMEPVQVSADEIRQRRQSYRNVPVIRAVREITVGEDQ